MHFAELSPYYYPTVDGQQLLTVGWLEREHPYPTGEVQPELIAKLRAIEQSNYPQQYFCAVTRGHHYCQFCFGNDRPGSDRELLIPDSDQPTLYYATTYLTSHYVEAHQYRPPDAFIQSVLAIDPRRPFDAIVVYDRLLLPRDVMRERYERLAKEAEQHTDSGRLESQLTETQREHVLRGSHRRYRKWLDENPS